MRKFSFIILGFFTVFNLEFVMANARGSSSSATAAPKTSTSSVTSSVSSLSSTSKNNVWSPDVQQLKTSISSVDADQSTILVNGFSLSTRKNSKGKDEGYTVILKLSQEKKVWQAGGDDIKTLVTALKTIVSYLRLQKVDAGNSVAGGITQSSIQDFLVKYLNNYQRDHIEINVWQNPNLKITEGKKTTIIDKAHSIGRYEGGGVRIVGNAISMFSGGVKKIQLDYEYK